MATLVIGAADGNIGDAFALLDVNRSKIVSTPTETELDVSSPIDAYKFFGSTTTVYDRIVYSAGVNNPAMIGSLYASDVASTFAVNVSGFIHMLNALRMSDGDESVQRSIVAVVSDAATVPMRGSIAYCSSKAALAMAIRCAAREMAPWWRVNGVAPGIVADTPMTDRLDDEIPAMRGWTTDEALSYERSLIPMERRCTKAEVAQLVLSVLDGPEYLTGAIIPITGGK
jgi:NAD(P)-dependent dehydrogenase (short-subunit alcohol dehydrogenase family)